MKKFSLTLVITGLLLVLSTQAASAASGSGKPDCPIDKSNAIDRMVKTETAIADSTIAMPDLSFIENCLNSISMPRGGFGLGFPSIRGIMSKVCNMMKSQITSQINNMSYNFNPLGSATGAFSGMPTQQVSYSSDLGTFADSFNGDSMSTATQPVTSQMGSALSIGTPSIVPSTNSSYMGGAVNNAMNFLTGSSSAGK